MLFNVDIHQRCCWGGSGAAVAGGVCSAATLKVFFTESSEMHWGSSGHDRSLLIIRKPMLKQHSVNTSYCHHTILTQPGLKNFLETCDDKKVVVVTLLLLKYFSMPFGEGFCSNNFTPCVDIGLKR